MRIQPASYFPPEILHESDPIYHTDDAVNIIAKVHKDAEHSRCYVCKRKKTNTL